MEQSLIFVAFGITGDLMRQKILPAIVKLREKKELSDDLKIIGISRRPAEEAKNTFGDAFYHVQGDANEPETYATLKELLDTFDTGVIGSGNKPVQKIIYISLSPVFYKTVFENLSIFGGDANSSSVKIMIEKPFGLSGAQAQELNTMLYKNFSEGQVYRVDHYLAKESVETLAGILRPEKHIARATVSFCETGGVEKRGASYDAVGALRDVGQNHVLEMLAVGASANTPEARASALEQLHVFSPHDAIQNTTHSQSAAYLAVQGIGQGSRTETSFTIKTSWRSIPLTLEGGKYLPEDKKGISITYADGSTKHFRIEENRGESEYERLVLDCIAGKKTLFVSEREIELLWRYIDPIVKVWYQ